jgi:plastocyanin
MRARAPARGTALALSALLTTVGPVDGQRLIERTPNLPNSVTALPGVLELSMPQRFHHVAGAGLISSPTFDIALGLPFLHPALWTVGLRFAPLSDLVPGRPNEWEFHDRVGLLRQTAGAPLDLTLTGAYNTAARSVDAEAALARRAGSVRVIGAARALTSSYDGDGARFALAGGVVWSLAPRRSPLALAADVATLTDRRGSEKIAWSAGMHAGLPFTALSAGVYAGNTATTTLHGASVGGSRTRYGFELNAPVELVGFMLGWFTDRNATRRSVKVDASDRPATVVRIRSFLYMPATVRIRPGDTVEWVNDDDAVHTVTAENGGFDSGGIRTGGRWRARFDEPGRFLYYCGPHPFMKAVVIVQP